MPTSAHTTRALSGSVQALVRTAYMIGGSPRAGFPHSRQPMPAQSQPLSGGCQLLLENNLFMA